MPDNMAESELVLTPGATGKSLQHLLAEIPRSVVVALLKLLFCLNDKGFDLLLLE